MGSGTAVATGTASTFSVTLSSNQADIGTRLVRLTRAGPRTGR